MSWLAGVNMTRCNEAGEIEVYFADENGTGEIVIPVEHWLEMTVTTCSLSELQKEIRNYRTRQLTREELAKGKAREAAA